MRGWNPGAREEQHVNSDMTGTVTRRATSRSGWLAVGALIGGLGLATAFAVPAMVEASKVPVDDTRKVGAGVTLPGPNVTYPDVPAVAESGGENSALHLTEVVSPPPPAKARTSTVSTARHTEPSHAPVVPSKPSGATEPAGTTKPGGPAKPPVNHPVKDKPPVKHPAKPPVKGKPPAKPPVKHPGKPPVTDHGPGKGHGPQTGPGKGHDHGKAPGRNR